MMPAMSLSQFMGERNAGGIPDALVTRNAVNLFGPGHSSGTGISTSAGTPVTVSRTFINVSGAPMTDVSLVLAGFIHTSTGTTNVGNDQPITADIEYPVGVTHNNMLQSGGTTITVPDGSRIRTDKVTLATPVPAGGSFKLNMSCTQSAGQKYIAEAASLHTGFGLSGICTTAMRSTLKKECLGAVGDSIATNNGGCVTTVAAYLGCPSMQMSISGTTAQTYGASSAANFTKQAALFNEIGCTRIISNWATNDMAAGRTAAQIKADILAMRSLANSYGILWTQCTVIPRTKKSTITTSAQAAAGNTMSLTVPDGTKFKVGGVYTIAGAGDAQYNGDKFCLSVVGNVLTFACVTGTPASTTGTVTITSRAWSTRELQVASSAAFNAGSGSVRGTFNADVRAGSYDGYIDWGDACELVRDDGVLAVFGDKPELVAELSTDVKTGTPLTNTRFQINGTWVNSVLANGRVQFLSGANIGETRNGNGNTGGDFTATSAYSNIPTVGDLIYVQPGSVTSDDGVHPRVATGTIGTANYKGGQALIVNPTIAWLQGLL